MEIRIRETGAVISEHEFRAMHPNVSFPAQLSPQVLADFGADPVLGAPAPTVAETQTAYRNGVTQDALGNWVHAWAVRDIPQEELDAAAASQTAALTKHYDGLVQGRLDDAARAFGYGDPNRPEVSPILHVVSYADEPAVPKFQAEGRLFRAWRSRTWATAAVILDAVRVNERPVPTEAELLVELEAAAPAPTEQDVAAEIVRLTA